ncbi:MAG: VWA domain-containing protein [Bacteroidota bacterium]
MNWTYLPGQTEFLLAAVFMLLYAAFMWRTRSIARRLRSRSRSVYIKLILRSIYFALFMVALLGPNIGESRKEVAAVGKDIYIAIDLSQSMNATDVQPSRLEKVKYALRQIVTAFRADRIGLIIFSSDAFVQCPLTYDGNALNMFIDGLNTNLVSAGGTDFGRALTLALDKLIDKSNKNKDADTDNQAKAIILISDGEDFGDETRDAASQIEDKGVKLFTLGVGTREGGPIPTQVGFLRDSEGRRVITALNSSDLKRLSEKTGGQYYEINRQTNEVSLLISAINRIKGVVREVRNVESGSNKFSYFLTAGLLLMVFDILFTIRIIRL